MAKSASEPQLKSFRELIFTILKTVQFYVKKTPKKLEASILIFAKKPEASAQKRQNLEFLIKNVYLRVFTHGQFFVPFLLGEL